MQYTTVIENLKWIQKGPLIATFDIKIPEWNNFIIRKAAFFTQENKKWVTFPSEKYEKDGMKKYFQLNTFKEKKDEEEFKSKALEAAQIELKNSTAKQPLFPSLQQPQEELPF